MISVVLVLLGCALACLASPLSWLVIPEHVILTPDLLTSFDVRGNFPDMTLLVGDLPALLRLQEVHPSAFVAAAFDPLRHASYLVIERADLLSTTPEDEAAWSFAVAEVLQQQRLRIIHSSRARFFVSGPPEASAALEQLPVESELVALPSSAISPVPSEHAERLLSLRMSMAKRADIADLVAQVSPSSLVSFNEYLSGERNDSSINSRNSFSPEIVPVAEWIRSAFEGFGFGAELQPFQATYGPNVIAVYPGSVQPEKFVVIGAHFDSRSTDRSSPTQRAPGANDDGSGTSTLLEIARIISENRLKFRYSVIIGAWCGEEQGLVGSRAYAQQCKREGLDIVAMLQGDMLAYRRAGERPQVAFPDRYHTPELTSTLMEVVRTYVPEAQVCTTPACCSDHQSFYEQGYAATQFFERCGSIADDQYHRSGDLVSRNGFDLEQWTYLSQAMFASLLTVAQVL